MWLLRNLKKNLIVFILTFIFLVNCFLAVAFRSYSLQFVDYSTPAPVEQELLFERYGKGYCVMYNFWKSAPEFYSGDHITLILHTTAEYLSYLKEQSKTWDGGISVALYIPSFSPDFIVPAITVRFEIRKRLRFRSRKFEYGFEFREVLPCMQSARIRFPCIYYL